MTNPEKDGLRSLDSINEVLFGYDVQALLVLLQVIHELGQNNLIHLNFPILSDFS
jgi:hypothetical protein